jgi:phosphoglycerol transferase
LNLLVVPDLRAYSRMSAFVAFFSLLASAVLARRLLGRLEASARKPYRGAVLAALVVFGVADQVPWASLYATRAGAAPRFAEDEEFVLRLERLLPAGAMVFQLPHASLPVHAPRPPRAPWDPAKAYLSSRSLRWSFGAMLGRTDRWHRTIERLPPEEMVERLALAGFSGIWLDRSAFSPPDVARLEDGLAEAAAYRPELSTGGRYAFFSIEAVRRRREAALGPKAYAAAREEVLGRGPAADR